VKAAAEIINPTPRSATVPDPDLEPVVNGEPGPSPVVLVGIGKAPPPEKVKVPVNDDFVDVMRVVGGPVVAPPRRVPVQELFHEDCAFKILCGTGPTVNEAEEQLAMSLHTPGELVCYRSQEDKWNQLVSQRLTRGCRLLLNYRCRMLIGTKHT
jgi:hypothetical protein